MWKTFNDAVLATGATFNNFGRRASSAAAVGGFMCLSFAGVTAMALPAPQIFAPGATEAIIAGHVGANTYDQ